MRSLILRAIASLLALALCAGGVAAQGRKKKRGKPAKASTSRTATAPQSAQPTQTYAGASVSGKPQHREHDDGVRRITPAEAREALAKGTAVMVDVRGEAAYKSGHIKDAILIPVNEVGARINKFPRNKLIITYCA